MLSCFKFSAALHHRGGTALCCALNCPVQPQNKAAEQEDKCRICCNEWFRVGKPFFGPSGSCISSLRHVLHLQDYGSCGDSFGDAKILSFRMILVLENLALWLFVLWGFQARRMHTMVAKPFFGPYGSCTISSLCHVPALLEAVVMASGAKILSFRMIMVLENLALWLFLWESQARRVHTMVAKPFFGP
jgi:hypothetical protein